MEQHDTFRQTHLPVCVYHEDCFANKISDLNIRKGPGTNYATTGLFTGKGVFTIVEEKNGQGSDAGWGRLKSGAGWISLDYCTKL